MDRFGGQYIPPGKRREMERKAAEAEANDVKVEANDGERPPGKRRGMERPQETSSGIAGRLGSSSGGGKRRQELPAGLVGRLGPLGGGHSIFSSALFGLSRSKKGNGNGDTENDGSRDSGQGIERVGIRARLGEKMKAKQPQKEQQDLPSDFKGDYSGKAGTHTLIVQNFRADIGEQQKGNLLQPLLAGGGSVQWISSTECMISYLNLGNVHKALNSKYNSSLTVSLLKDLGETGLGYYDAAAQLQETLKRPKSSSQVANRLIGRALGIRVRPSNTQPSLKKPQKQTETVDAWDD